MGDNSKIKVHVALYGGKSIFGGKEKPLVADEVFCSNSQNCQFFASGTCMCCRALDTAYCPYGTVRKTKGYTSRAKKYSDFRDKYRDDPSYDALKRPRDVYLRVVGDWVLVHLPPLSIDYIEDPEKFDKMESERFIGSTGKIRANDGGLGMSFSCWIPKEELDVDSIINLMKRIPRSFTGNVIKDYQNIVVPAFMDDLKNFWPERYAEVGEKRADLCELEVDYRGRMAKVLTLRDGITVKAHSNTFTLDGNKLVCADYRDPLGSICGVKIRGAKLELPLDDEDYIEVKDNSWVVPGTTVFA